MNNLTANTFIIDFNKKWVNTKNRTYLIENEIRQIEIYVSSNEIIKPERKTMLKGMILSAPTTNSVFKLNYTFSFSKEKFNTHFNNNLLGETYTPGKYEPNDWYKAEIYIEANNLADYYTWLKEKLENESKSKLKAQQPSLNLEQKLLALHLLGLDFQDHTNSHMAKALGQILNAGSQNIRGNLSNMYGGKNSIRKIENFEKLSELFENKTFESISNKIKKEIKQLKQKL